MEVTNIKFSNFFNEHFSISTWISSIISIVIGCLGTLFFSKIMIPVGVLAVISCISLVIIWFLLIIIFSPSRKLDSPFNLDLIKFISNSTNNLCILKPCEYLSIGTYITIFYIDDNFEAYFATGTVTNIQNDKLIQVTLLHIVEDSVLTNNAFANDISFLNSLIIKPIITNKYLEERS